MENDQIAIIIILILALILAILMSTKILNFIRQNNQNVQNSNPIIRHIIINIYYQILSLAIPGIQYIRIKLTQDEIIYFENQHQKLIYRFQVDNKYNWQYCRYTQNQDIIRVYDGDTDRISERSEPQLIFFSTVNIENNQTYFYNYPITQQQINDNNINILNAYISHLNRLNWKSFVTNDNFKKIEILFLPSNICENETSINIEQNFNRFLFFFRPINYQVQLLYKRLFFISNNSRNNNTILIEFKIEGSSLIVHDSLADNDLEQYKDLQQSLRFLSPQTIYPSFCPTCKNNGKQYSMEDIGNSARQYNFGDIQQDQLDTYSGFKNWMQEQFKN